MDTPARAMLKGYFAGFQYCELASGSVAAPTSPSAPARASGAIESDVTPVYTGLNWSFCENDGTARTARRNSRIILFLIICFVYIADRENTRTMTTPIYNFKIPYLLFTTTIFPVFDDETTPSSSIYALTRYTPVGNERPPKPAPFHSRLYVLSPQTTLSLLLQRICP